MSGVTLSNETYDRFQTAYVALADALHEARPYVHAWAINHPSSPVASSVLQRIDAALAMEANLPEKPESQADGPSDRGDALKSRAARYREIGERRKAHNQRLHDGSA